MARVTQMATRAMMPSETVVVTEVLKTPRRVWVSSMTRLTTFPALFTWKKRRER